MQRSLYIVAILLPVPTNSRSTTRWIAFATRGEPASLLEKTRSRVAPLRPALEPNTAASNTPANTPPMRAWSAAFATCPWPGRSPVTTICFETASSTGRTRSIASGSPAG